MSIEQPSTAPSMRTATAARTAAAATFLGGLLQFGGGILETVDRVVPGEPGYVLRVTLFSAVYLLMGAGVVGLWQSGAVGRSRPGRYGLAAAGLGWVGWAVAQLLLPVDFDVASFALFPAGGFLIGVGMIVAGVAVLRAGAWGNWQRFVPIGCGLYGTLLVASIPVLGGPNFGLFAAHGVCYVVLATALWTTSSSRPPWSHG